MYTLILNNLESKITPMISGDIASAIDASLSYKTLGHEYSPSFKKGHWNGFIKLFRKTTQTYPTGLLSRVLGVFNHYQMPFELLDNREKPEHGTPYDISGLFEFRSYQDEIDDAMHKYGRGIVKSATGSGKSCSIVRYIAAIDVPTLIVVPRISLLAQFHRDLEKWLKVPIGRIGDGIYDPKRITVTTMQSIAAVYAQVYACPNHPDDSLISLKRVTKKCDICMEPYRLVMGEDESEHKQIIRDVLGNVQCLIVDECQSLATASLKILQQHAYNAYYRFGFSATPWSLADDNMLIEAFTGRVIVDIHASRLIQEGYLSRPYIKMYEFKHGECPPDLDKNGSPKKITYATVYKNLIVNNYRRNKLMVDLAVEKLKQGKSVLIAINHIAHGKILEEMLKQATKEDGLFVNGSFESDELLDALDRLNKKLIMWVVATTVLSVGVNVPCLDCLIIGKANEGKIETLQLVGRVLRKTDVKNTVDVIDILDRKQKYLTAHATARKTVYESEPEFNLEIIKESTLC